jgi:hypothetical protein
MKQSLFIYLVFHSFSFFAQTNDNSMDSGASGNGNGLVNYVNNGNFNSGTGPIFNCGTSDAAVYNGTYWNGATGVEPMPFMEWNEDWPYGFSWVCNVVALGNHPASVSYGGPFVRGYLQVNFAYSTNNSPKWSYFLMTLNAPLMDGREYTLQADLASRVTSPNADQLYTDRIGFALLDSMPTTATSAFLQGITPNYETPSGQIITQAPIHISHTVMGAGQRYLIVGLFQPMDSLSLTGAADDNYNCIYILDNIKLYSPQCQHDTLPAPHPYFVYAEESETKCPGQQASFTANSGFAPYTWEIDGIVQATQTNSLQFIADDQDHLITVSCDTGSCITSDHAVLISKAIHTSLPNDTLFPCATQLDIVPGFSSSNVSTNSWSVHWTGLNTIYNDSWTTTSSWSPDLTTALPGPGVYQLDIDYYNNTCHYFDTLVVLSNPGLLTDSLSQQIVEPLVGSEHCINMSDGYIIFNTNNYPGELIFNWPANLGLSTEVNYLLQSNTGNYEISIYDTAGRCNPYSLFIPLSMDGCSTIQGKVEFDPIYNCDSLNQRIPFASQKVVASPLGNFAFTDSTGIYSIHVPPGNYQVQRIYESSTMNVECSENTNVSLANAGEIAFNVNFVDTLQHNIFDFEINNIFTTLPLQLNTDLFLITEVQNMGDVASSGLLKILVDEPLVVLNASNLPGFAGINNDTILLWTPVIQPLNTYTYSIPVHITQNLAILNNLITFKAWIVLNGDNNFEGNYATYEAPIVGSYDPNDKTVSPVGYSSSHYIDISNRTLDYLIRFQNTGNYPATNIRIVDQLDLSLDASSILLKSTSHDVSVNYYDGQLEFIFTEIMLPDSGLNEPESHGFVAFSININAEVMPPTAIENVVSIFFDANPPIVTNSTLNTLYDCNTFNANFAVEWAGCGTTIQTQYDGDMIHDLFWSLNGTPFSTETNPVLEGVVGDNWLYLMVEHAFCGSDIDSSLVILPTVPELNILSNATMICENAFPILNSETDGGSWQWLYNGELAGTESTLIAQQSGLYQLIWTLNGCDLLSNVFYLAENTADINLDGLINIEDLLVLQNEFGCVGSCDSDLDNDSIVGTNDVRILIANWGRYCP